MARVKTLDPSGQKLVKRVNFDNWNSEITNLGTSLDKRMSYNPSTLKVLAQPQLDFIYRNGYLARKIVLIPPKDMTREGIKITPDETITPDRITQINDKMKSDKVWVHIRRALQWSRLYQGAVVVMIIEDGGESWEPVNIDGIKTIRGLYVLDSFQILPHTYQADVSLPEYGSIETYQINSTPTFAARGGIGAETEAIGSEWHKSRLMVFDGVDLPDQSRVENNGWGDSLFQTVLNALRNFNQGQDGAASLVSDFSQAVFKIKQLHEKVGAGGGDVIASRMALMNLARSMIGAVVIDADGEEFERKATPLTGLDAVMNQFERAVVAASGMPHTILFGDSPSGLGASGSSEEKTYKDDIKADQESQISPNLDKYFNLYSHSKESKLDGTTINYGYVSLFQMSEKEQADIRKIISEADKNNIQFNVYSDDEARTRYESDEFSLDISLDETRSELKRIEPEEIE